MKEEKTMNKKMIKFIEKKFSTHEAAAIIKNFDKEIKKMETIEKSELSNRDFHVACTSIFDRIAAYQSFQLYLQPSKARKYCEEYFYTRVKGLRRLLHFLTRSRLGANLFKKAFVKGLERGPLQYELKTYNKQCLIFDVHQCIFRDLCKKYECEELSTLFCNGDHFMFDHMKKLDFQRNQTLGKGGKLCDFHFINKS